MINAGDAENDIAQGSGRSVPGFCLLSDVHDNTSYGPWKRGLVKVGKEENFHLLHGRRWMQRLVSSGEGRQLVQEAVDWPARLQDEGAHQRPAAPVLDG